MKTLSFGSSLLFALAFLTACSTQKPGTPPSVVTAPLEASCTDGTDQDLDGLIDCADPDCTADVACDGHFACTPDFFQVAVLVNSGIASINPAVNPWGFNVLSLDLGLVVNAAGYRLSDSYIYALAGADLVRIESDGTATNLGAVTGGNFAGVANVGEFDGQGFLWVKWFDDEVAYKINVATRTATEVAAPKTGDDWAYNVDENAFYSVDAMNNLVVFDLDTLTSHTIGITGALQAGAHGAEWFDSDGRLYAFDSTTGHIRAINVTTGAATFVGTILPSAGSDGANCNYAIPAFEICGNGVDDDGDGVTDENGDDLDPDANHCLTFPDTDGDGVINGQDLDDDNDGIPDVLEKGDTDGDGVPDRRDLDSDNDGILDVVEAGHDAADANDDGRVDGAVGDNGLADAVETAADSNVLGYTLRHSDNDGTPDFQDLDSDNDTVSDHVEGFDANGDGAADVSASGDDVDGDGVDDAFDVTEGGTKAPLPDTDAASVDDGPNYRDADDDGDGTPTKDELGDDNNNNIPDYLESSFIGGGDNDGGTADGGIVGDGGDDDAGTDGGGGRPGTGAAKLAGGAGCTVGHGTSGGTGLGLALLGLAAVLLLRRRRGLGALLVLAIVVGVFGAAAAPASAQFTLDRYRSAPTIYDGFYVSRPDDRGHLKFGVHLTFDYANDPLVVEAVGGDADSESGRVISDQLVGALSLNLGLWDRVVLFGGVPVTLWSDSDIGTGGTLNGNADSGLGDPWAGLRLRLLGDNDDVFGAAVQGTVTFPAADAAKSDQRFLGEEGFTFQPELLLELRPGPVRITANAGVLLRKKQEVGTLLALGNEFRWSAALSLDLVKDRFTAMAEAYGSTPLGKIVDGVSFGNREGTPLELIGGFKYFSPKGVSLGLAGGSGLTRGYGSPDFRVIAQLGFAARKDGPAKEEAAPVVRDTDGDGILDDRDACVNDPEDKDGFEDEDGCPDPDNDQDGVLDVNDKCPMEAEDKDGFEDEDGCPDPDNDQDGILDGADQCPLQAEDKDGFEDEDGCPDPDNDQDTVLDADDKCPTAPGQPSTNPEENGCPKSVRMDEASGQILILKRVEFATGKDVILPSSDAVLQEVQATIAANKQIKRIRVEGHTDDRGDGAKNMDLSKRRAKSVMKWLVSHGIAGERVEAYGCGENIPMETNKTAAGRQTNRRVEFHIVDPAPANGARSTNGCEQISGE